MALIKNDDLQAICSWYSLANTPAFLFRKLMKTSAVQQLIKTNSDQELLSALSEITSKESKFRTVADIASAYAILIAVSLKFAGGIPSEKLSSIDLSSLDWANQIIVLASKAQVPTMSLTLDLSEKYAPSISVSSDTTR